MCRPPIFSTDSILLSYVYENNQNIVILALDYVTDQSAG